jgi:hypothetical protein
MNELIGVAVLLSIIGYQGIALVIAMRFMKKSFEVGILGLISLVTPWEFFFSKARALEFIGYFLVLVIILIKVTTTFRH